MSIAKSYARALYETAREANASVDDLNQLEVQMDAFMDFLNSSKDAKTILLSPVTSAKDKGLYFQSVAKVSGISTTLANFLSLLARKGRLTIFEDIRRAFRVTRLDAEGGVEGQLESAEPIGKDDVETLSKAFSKKFGKKVAFQIFTDPTLLAGMKVTVNGVTYDGTLRSQFQRLRDQLAQSRAEG